MGVPWGAGWRPGGVFPSLEPQPGEARGQKRRAPAGTERREGWKPVRRVRKFPTHIVVFLAPAVLIYTVFMIYPMLSSLWLSLLNRIPGGGTGFVGLQNYVTLLTSEHWAPRFWNAFRNNVIFFVIHMLVQNPVALAL